MANPSKTGDSGTAATAETARLPVFSTGMPASNPTTDYGTATSTAARPDTFNPPSVLYTNPPSAPTDLGSA